MLSSYLSGHSALFIFAKLVVLAIVLLIWFNLRSLPVT